MESKDFQRKLAVILSADVKGYSRLMGEDEVETIRTLTSYQEVMVTLIQQYRGRVVDSPGDNLLAEFASVVDALQCAVRIQGELRALNARLPDDRKMEFRIGINLGDVVVEGERIYGDGVNIAARLEGLAEPGGICISGSAYDQVENKLALEYDYLGEQAVKNIKKPVRVYRVRIRSETTSPNRGRMGESPDRPSIAVLPFVNMSGDPEQEYFSDGMTEDLITDLSKLSNLFVIARNSAFTYKGKAVKVEQVSQELGVRFVLEGSVRKAGGRVRITAQLVDGTTGGHVWAERYDRDLSDIFTMQDEVTEKIIAALRVRMEETEAERVLRKGTENLKAYDYVLRGRAYVYRCTREGFSAAREMFTKALELDPEYAGAYVGLGWISFNEWSMQLSQDPKSLDQAIELAKRAIALDRSLPSAYSLLGHAYLWKKQYEQAIAENQIAIALDPNDADNYGDLAEILTWTGRPEEAIGWMAKAMRLNPHYPAHYLSTLGFACFCAGQYQEAISALKRALLHNPDLLAPHILLTIIFSESGRIEEARVEAAEILRINPGYSLEVMKETIPFKSSERLEACLGALRKAGIG